MGDRLRVGLDGLLGGLGALLFEVALHLGVVAEHEVAEDVVVALCATLTNTRPCARTQ